MNTIRCIIILCIAMMLAATAWAKDLSVTKQQLGNLLQDTTSVTAISHYAGQNIKAKVMSLPGHASTIISPMNVRKTTFLKPNGALLESGDSFVALSGPEVHHYYVEYTLKKALFEQNTLLYGNNKKLFLKKALSEQAWLEVSKTYIDFKLMFEEFSHFFELVDSFDDKNDTLILKSPLQGRLNYQNVFNISTNELLASIIPLQSVRIAAKIPLSQIQNPSYLRIGECQLAVEFSEQVANGYLRQLWSEPLNDKCPLVLNQPLSVIPEYALNSFLVNKSSVFSLHGVHYVFVEKTDKYTAISVELISAQQSEYVVTSEGLSNTMQVLSTSVSAAQGILMGIGE